MTICVYAEPLLVATSANPCRGMLRELVAINPSDDFIFVVRRGSEANAQLLAFMDSLNCSNWNLYVERTSRRRSNVEALLGLDNYCRVNVEADVYLNMDTGYLGPKAKPLVSVVTDLSSVRDPKRSSLRWHGVRIFRHALQTIMDHADRVVTISDFTRRDLELYMPELRGRCMVIHNGIDSIWFQPREFAKENPASLSLKQPYWIWWGLMTPRKNLNGLLNAYAKLREEHSRPGQIPDLMLVGNRGVGTEDLRDLATTLGLTKYVQWAPFQPIGTLTSLVDSSVGLVFPSLCEGFGLPIIESMARGIPVLTSNKTSMPEVAGGLAVLCDPDDPVSLVGGLREMMLQGYQSRDAVQARREWAAQFTHERAALKYSALLSAVAQPSHTL